MPSDARIEGNVRWLAACALVVLWLAGCAPTPTRLDRIAPPVRFAMLRETAAWCADFDPSWWSAIDARYARYDRALDDVIAARWTPFAEQVALARQQGRLPDARTARQQWARHREISGEVGGMERALVVDIDEALPPQADGFVALLSARLEFARASAMFCEPGQVLPAPLEVLALNGRAPLSPDELDAVVAAYRALTATASDIASAHADDFVRYCDEKRAFDAAWAAALAAASDAAAAREAQQRCEMDFEQSTQALVERLRTALLAQGARTAEALPDGERRSDYVSRLDAYLHEGVRSLPSLRAVWQIGRLLLAREEGVTAAQVAWFDEQYRELLVRDAALRPLLRAPSLEARRDAYRELVQLVVPMRSALADVFGRHSDIADRIDLATFAVTAGDATPAQAADAIARDLAEREAGNAEPGAAAAMPPALFPGRDNGMQLLLGAPLRESVLAACMTRVRLPAEEARRLAPRIAAIREELAAQTEMVPREIVEEIRALDRGGDVDAAMNELSRFMGSLRGKVERVRALDRSANERILAEIARAARVPPDDERLAITRLELALLSEIGTDRPMGEAEGLGGLVSVAVVNPFEVVRSMGADEAQRALAESVVVARGPELMAAQREARAALEQNIRGLLAALVRGDAARRGTGAADEQPWRATLAGRAAAEIRLAIAEDLRAAIGPFAADSYLARLREIAEPALEPGRAPAFVRLDRFAAGVGLDARARADGAETRTVVAELLDQADERRSAALAATLRWRASWLAVEPLESPAHWRELARSAPLGWIALSRAADADERAFAACDALLSDDAASADGARAAREFTLVLPMRLRPHLE